MNQSKKWLFLVGALVLAIALAGCDSASTGASAEVAVDSGVIDVDYEGVTNPVLPQEFKLTEEEKKNGVQKITIKGGVQIDTPDSQTGEEADAQETESVEEEPADDGGEERARPKI